MLGRAPAWLISTAALGLAILLRWLLDPVLDDRQALTLLYGAVGIAVWVGGWQPATAVVFAGYLASDWLFIPPRGAFGLNTAPDVIAATLYLVSCGIIIAFGEAMRRARDQLLASNRAVEQQREELVRLNVELKGADQRKDHFLATLSHELRSPLAPIRTSVQIWKSAAATEEQRARAADVVDRQTTQMARLLEELLDVSRIKQGKIDIRKTSVLLADIVESAVEISRPNIDARRHELRVSLPAQPIRLHADRERLVQVVSNLLNNSAKYTDPDGRIELRASVDGGTVELQVEDNGIGFSAEMGEQLFLPFSQLESASGRSQGGLGIGLALVKAIAELHGGSVVARSEGPRCGARFIVRIPAGDVYPVA